MKKELLKRCLMGALGGIAVSMAITILISFIVGDGSYHPAAISLVKACGTELNAVVVQAVASMLYGALYAGVSVIWEIESWSILKQTVVHFLFCSIGTLPIAYFMHWMHHSVWGVISYFGIFVIIYFIIWASMYSTMKKRVREINEKMQKANQ